jgi:hypothetical protein
MIGTLFFYSGVTGLSELLKLSDYKKIVLPLALIVFIMTGVVFPNDIYNLNWLGMVWIPYSATMGFLIPLLLLIVYAVKKIIKQVFE